MILFAESEEKLKDMLEDLNNEGKRDGMKLNKKTKIMCNEVARSRVRKGLMIDREQFEEVTDYKYLGRLVTSGNEISKEIAQRIKSGCRRFGEYSHFLKDRKIPICLERTIIDTVSLPAMTCGAETWASGEEAAVAQRSMEKLLLNITKREKIRNEIIRSKTGVTCIIEKVGKTCSQNDQHQVGQQNIRMDTQRMKTSKRETQKEMERQHRGGW